MEFEFLNQIITSSVGSLFKSPAPRTLKREVVALSETPSLQFSKNVKPQTTTSLNTSITSNAELGKKLRDNSMSGTDLRSFVESSLNISREDQSIHKSPNQSLQKSVEIGRMPLKTFENPRQIIKDLSSKSIDSPQLSVQSSTTSLEMKPNTSIQETRDSKQSKLIQIHSLEEIQSKQTKPLQPPSFETWITLEGPKKLEESLKRLKLDVTNISKINLEEMPFDVLQSQKRAVKNELKSYDSCFYSVFKKQPERREKEVMRPLYVYYKKLKQFITKPKTKEAETKTLSTNANQNPHFSTVKVPGQLSEASINKQQQQLFGSLKNENLLNLNLSTITQQSSKGQAKENITASPLNYGAKQGLQNNNSSANSVSGTLNYKHKEPESSNSKLEELRAERTRLREKLHKYQSEFTKNNSRKIRYHKDIEPIEEEYKRYKNIKNEIVKLETGFQHQFK